MKSDFVSWVGRIQMDPNSRLDTYENEKTAPFEVVTSVVPTTTSPMPKSEQENGFVKWNRIAGSQWVFSECLYVPCVGNVRAFIYVALDSSYCGC